MAALSEMQGVFRQRADAEVKRDFPLFQQVVHGALEDVTQHWGNRLKQGADVADVQGCHVNGLGHEAMGLASTEPADQSELAVLSVIAEGQLMRQQRLPNAI